MFIDQITLAEGSVLENLTVAQGTLFPPQANSGELFFRTDIDGGSLYIFTGGQWIKTSKPTDITAAAIGLGNVTNTSDNNKPVSAAQQAALNLKANISSLGAVAFSNNYVDLTNKPTAASIGLGNVDNTSDLNKPISTATQNALNLKTDDATLHSVAKSGNFNELINKPAVVTLVSLGLNNVNNTSDANKPISVAQQAALNLKANISSLHAVATSGSYLDLINTPTITPVSLGLHAVATSGDYNSLTNKPAAATAASIGLGNVDNTADISKPISTATQNALDLKTDDATLHQVAKSGNYAHLSNKPIITPATLGLATVATSGSYLDLSNKPVVTAASIGLENVDNTSDVSKPISTATQNALDLKLNISALPTFATVATTGSYNDLLDLPSGSGSYTLPVASDTVLGGVKQGTGVVIDVDGTINVSSGGGGGGSYTLPVASAITLGGVMIGSGLSITSGVLSTDLSAVATSGDYTDLLNKPVITKTAIGLGNVDNTSDVNKPVSTAQASAIALKANISSLSTVATSGDYADLLNKPVITPISLGLHSVATTGDYNDLSNLPTITGATAASIGLGNVDNTSDMNKPVSSAQQAALDLKANISSLATVATSGSYLDLSNLPTITPATKVSVGLGNVDNTSDLNKPISTATQVALDLKLNAGALAIVATSGQYSDLTGSPVLATVATSGDYADLLNKPAITKAAIGLGSVENTSDANKIISNLTQAALDLKADISSLGATAFSNDYNDLANKPAGGSYTLPISSVSTLGGVKVGTGLTIDVDGTLNATGGGSYTLPVATNTTLGGVKQGAGLFINGSGEISFNIGLSSVAFIGQGTVENLENVRIGEILDQFSVPVNPLTVNDTITYVTEIDTRTYDITRFYLDSSDPDWLDINDSQYYVSYWTNKQPTGGGGSVTAASIGLGNVNNTSDLNKPISTATQNALDNKLDISALSAVGGSGNYNDLSNVPATFTPPVASATVLGGVKIGSGLSITAGVLSSTGGYTLPVATNTTLGGVKQGSGITILGDGTISASGGGGGSVETLSPFLLMGA